MEPESELQVFGSDFLLNGNPIEGLEPGGSILLELKEDSLLHSFHNSYDLSATLSDGSSFDVSLNKYSLDHFLIGIAADRQPSV
jgi:hypothetical protein